MVYYNPHITERYNPLYTLKVFFIAQLFWPICGNNSNFKGRHIFSWKTMWITKCIHLSKTNSWNPKTGGLEDVFPFPRGYFQFPCQFSGVHISFQNRFV